MERITARDDLLMWRLPNTRIYKFEDELTREEAILIGKDLRRQLAELREMFANPPNDIARANGHIREHDIPRCEEVMRAFEDTFRRRWMQPSGR